MIAESATPNDTTVLECKLTSQNYCSLFVNFGQGPMRSVPYKPSAATAAAAQQLLVLLVSLLLLTAVIVLLHLIAAFHFAGPGAAAVLLLLSELHSVCGILHP